MLGRLSISYKLALPVVASSLFFAITAVTLVIPSANAALLAQSREANAAIPSALASALIDLMATKQYAAVTIAIEDASKKGDVLYVMVVDAKGAVRASAGSMAGSIDARRIAGQTSATLHVADTEVLDLGSPIMGGALGQVHVGFNHGAVRARIGDVTTKLTLMLLLPTLVSALGAIVYARRLLVPLLKLTHITNRIVEHGDLRDEIAVSSGDEIGQLANSFAKLVKKLREIPAQLGDSVEKLTGLVDLLSVAAKAQTESVTRQASALQQTQVTTQELKTISHVASERAESVLRVASRAEQVGQAGEEAIDGTLSALAEMRVQVGEIARQMGDLGENTRQISEITQTVKDLADQSNMLALNAAIEAVRSGEHGKGFSVVAREIRSLADQSIQATKRVREILEEVERAIGRALLVSETGAGKMEAGMEQVRDSGRNLRELSTIVKDNGAAVRQIAAAVSQQSAGISQIFGAVTDLSAVMANTAAQARSTEESTLVLKEAAARINLVLKEYRA